MKRDTQVEYEDATPEVRAIYDEIMDTMGSPSVLKFLKALGHNPHTLHAVWSMLKETVIEGEIHALPAFRLRFLWRSRSSPAPRSNRRVLRTRTGTSRISSETRDSRRVRSTSSLPWGSSAS
jgi:hypothetical protein